MRGLLWILLGLCLSMPVVGADSTARLVAAAGAGRAAEVRELLVEGVDANTKNGSGRPVLVGARVVAEINVGNRRIDLMFMGRAHTAGCCSTNAPGQPPRPRLTRASRNEVATRSRSAPGCVIIHTAVLAIRTIDLPPYSSHFSSLDTD